MASFLHSEVLSNPDLTPADKIVAALLVDLSREENRWPSNREIIQLTAISKASVSNSLTRLEKAGFLFLHYDYNSNKKRREIILSPVLNFRTAVKGKEVSRSLLLPKPRGLNKNNLTPNVPNSPPETKGDTPMTEIKKKMRARIQGSFFDFAGGRKARETKEKKIKREAAKNGMTTSGHNIPRNRFVEFWNSLPGPHRHHSLGTGVYRKAAERLNQIQKTLKRVDPQWAEARGIPAGLLTREWSDAEICEGIRRLSLLFTPEYNPDAVAYPADLASLVLNPLTKKSQLVYVMKNYPGPFLSPAEEKNVAEQKLKKISAPYLQSLLEIAVNTFLNNNGPLSLERPEDYLDEMKPENRERFELYIRELYTWWTNCEDYFGSGGWFTYSLKRILTEYSGYLLEKYNWVDKETAFHYYNIRKSHFSHFLKVDIEKETGQNWFGKLKPIDIEDPLAPPPADTPVYVCWGEQEQISRRKWLEDNPDIAERRMAEEYAGKVSPYDLIPTGYKDPADDIPRKPRDLHRGGWNGGPR